MAKMISEEQGDKYDPQGHKHKPCKGHRGHETGARQTERLNEENVLEWVGRMNNIRACVREIVNDEIIFTQAMRWQRLKLCHLFFGEFWLIDVKSLAIGDSVAYKRK